MEIQTTIKKFNYKRLNSSIYGRAHDAIIGEWIRWWTTDILKKKGNIHSVINPAIHARFRGKRYCADILLGEHSKKTDIEKDIDDVVREFFRIVGVVEVENDNSLEKLKHRTNSLYAYEKCRDKKRRVKFPDLKFGILCTFFFDEDWKERKYEIKKIKDYMKKKSRDSTMTWVMYILNKDEIENDYFFRVTGYAKDPYRESFYYGESFIGKPIYHIFQRGRQLRIRAK